MRIAICTPSAAATAASASPCGASRASARAGRLPLAVLPFRAFALPDFQEKWTFKSTFLCEERSERRVSGGSDKVNTERPGSRMGKRERS